MTNQPAFEEEYFDVLRAIETQIYEYYLEKPDLLDFNVDKALNAIVRTLNKQQHGQSPPKIKLNAAEQAIYKLLETVASLYLGKDDDVKPEQVLSYDEMIACVKRIQRSLKQMSSHGRQGYLDFLKQFFGE